MRNKQRLVMLLCTCSVALSLCHFSGCARKEKTQKELLIYCGITMIKPMSEIARIIEAQENCKILITKGGSGDLLRSLKINQVGDLYLPGSDSYINTCLRENRVSKTAHVGYNKAAILVQKGNPKGITANLDNLTRKDYYIVIGNPASGSIGRETKKILEKKGIFEQAIANAQELTTDSKNLTQVIKDKKADIVINWYATSVWSENSDDIDALGIDEQYASKKKLVIGLLNTSRYPDIAESFMDYAASKKGQEIFRKHGFYDVK